MALDWLKSRRQNQTYAKAIEQLQLQLKKRRNDPRTMLQLAEVLIQADRKKEALPLFEAVADEFALEGFAARAIAILKRVRTIDPQNTQAEEKLAYLISQQDNPAPSPWGAREQRPMLDIGMEEFSEDDELGGMEVISQKAPELGADWGGSPPATPTPPVPPEVYAASAEPPPVAPPPAAPSAEVPPASAPPPSAPAAAPAVPVVSFDLNDDNVRHEFLELIDVAFSSTAPTASASGPSSGVAASPLFSDFRPDELLAVMRGLKLLTFEPGEIIVSQGESGDSLFIVASGKARAYLKDRAGRNVQVRELMDGDFFGEIALMSGGPRTATVTAYSRCELLVLDRAGLDSVATPHPRVREVLQEFYVKRVNTSLDAATRSGEV